MAELISIAGNQKRVFSLETFEQLNADLVVRILNLMCETEFRKFETFPELRPNGHPDELWPRQLPFFRGNDSLASGANLYRRPVF